MKLNVYIMHSDKVDYKNNIYKPLLKLGLMKDYFLILPMSENFKSTYIKELLNKSDVVICDLSKCNIFLSFEIKNAVKLNKKIYYLISSSDKKIKKYKNIDLISYSDSGDYANKVKSILDSLNKKELLLNRENIYTLGKVN